MSPAPASAHAPASCGSQQSNFAPIQGNETGGCYPVQQVFFHLYNFWRADKSSEQIQDPGQLRMAHLCWVSSLFGIDVGENY